MTGNGTEVDRQTLEACRCGDRRAFRALVESLKRPAYFHALSLVGNHHDALDLSQEAFIRAWRAFASFETSRPFFPWFYRILRNLCLNRHRSRIRRETMLERFRDSYVVPQQSGGFDARETFDRRETVAMVNKTLADLRAEDREIILLKDLHGHSYREISELLGIPPGTVMSRLFEARKRFRARFNEPASARAPAHT